MFKNFFTIFLVVLLLGIGLVGFWYFQKNSYSKEILKIEILGPEHAQAGEEIEYLVRYKNNGDVVLENPELTFEYPEHSFPLNDSALRWTKKIEDIYPGEEKSFKFRARLLGKKNEILTAKTWLSYYPKNLKAEYESRTTFSTQVQFVPLTFEFDLPSKIEAKQGLRFSLNYFSKFDCELFDLRVKLTYPDGFSFETSVPQSLEKTEWQISSLPQTSGGRIDILGDIDGEIGEQKVFRAELSMYKNGESVVLKKASQSIQIIEPAIYISQAVNNSPDYIANPGDLLHYEIFFKNIGEKPFNKKFLLVKLNGGAFDIETLRSDNGEIGSGDNTILFDWKNIPELSFLEVGEEGKVEFWIKVKDEKIGQRRKNLVLGDEVIISEAKEEFEVKINSKLIVLQKAYFQEEFLDDPNSGPLPPEVGETTTYTILWQIKNYSNDLNNLKVKAILPSNVKPTGNFFPEDPKFTFDSVSREAIWNIGDVEAYQGTGEIPLALAFQVSLAPKQSQRGDSAVLVKQVGAVGQDEFTKDILDSNASEIDTILPNDESVSEQQGIVK